jgi:hypothetical protein
MSFRTIDIFGHVLPAIADVSALAIHSEPIGIFKLYKVMVVNFSMFLPIGIVCGVAPDLPAAMAIGLDRIGTLNPVDDIGVVDVLLHNVVATEPVKVKPIPNLVFELILTGCSFLGPNTSTIPEYTGIVKLSNGTILNSFYSLNIIVLVVAL